jgi:HK97 family phage major capsid protein
MLKSAQNNMEEHGEAAEAIIRKAESENRDRTDDENSQIAEHQKAIHVLRDQAQELEGQVEIERDVMRDAAEITSPSGGNGGSPEMRVIQEPPRRKSIGEQFVESDSYKKMVEQRGPSGGLPEGFSTGPVQLDTKGTLLEGAGAPGAGTGGGLLPVPTVEPGVTETLFQRLTVADLMPAATTNTNTVRYTVEGTATSGATGVAEGASKPESTLALSTVDEPVKKIATSLTVSDEMLEDAAQAQGYINGRLQLFVKIQEEFQLVRGGGTNSLVGIVGRSGVNTYSFAGTAFGDGLFKAINGTRGSSFLEPSAIIMNPAEWQTFRLAKDTAGQYFGGGPFLGPYGGPQGPIGPGGQVTGADDVAWNKPIIVTSAIGAGTLLLGAFDTAAQVYRRSGLTVEASNSHSDYFEKNLVKIRAEQRLALAVYRPSAFTLVTVT